jgi:hypothetical protein
MTGDGMQTLLVAAIIITVLAIVVQAGVLIAMYLMSRRVADNVDGLVNESQKLMTPLAQVAANFQTASKSLLQVGHDAREEMHRVEAILHDTQNAIRDEIQDLRHRVNATFDEVHDTVIGPIREWSAIAIGISAGVRTFFGKRRPRPAKEERQKPAA